MSAIVTTDRKRRGRKLVTPKRATGSTVRGPCPGCGAWAALRLAGCCAKCSEGDLRDV